MLCQLCATSVSSNDISGNSHFPGFSFFIDRERIIATRFHYGIMRKEVNSAHEVAGNIAQQVERAKDKKEVTAQELKDGYRAIGRMTVISVHISANKELVKFGPAPLTVKAPDAKKMKYPLVNMHGSRMRTMQG